MSREEWLLIISLPVYIISISSEFVIGKKRQINNYDWKDSWVSLGLGIAGAGLDFMMRYITLGVLDWCNAHALFQA
ncbi:MAG: hypothetical protein IT245_08700, partial [Bacteroidia bacterium]|nr:hypothetical protein [Bacteroidia bacterium]